MIGASDTMVLGGEPVSLWQCEQGAQTQSTRLARDAPIAAARVRRRAARASLAHPLEMCYHAARQGTTSETQSEAVTGVSQLPTYGLTPRRAPGGQGARRAAARAQTARRVVAAPRKPAGGATASRRRSYECKRASIAAHVSSRSARSRWCRTHEFPDTTVPRVKPLWVKGCPRSPSPRLALWHRACVSSTL